MTEARPRVYIFGAGIAGLTAAHELIERAFDVVVIERDEDWESEQHRFPCAVGGMAKSQWAWAQEGATPAAPRSPLAEVTRAVHFDQTVDLRSPTPFHALEHALMNHRFRGPLPIAAHGSPHAIERVRAWYDAHLPILGRHGAEPSFQEYPTTDTAQDSEHVRITVKREVSVLPGEHGFRFFPGFYRHVFDTMQRIPLQRPSAEPDPAQASRSADDNRTVYDNLVPTRASGLGLEGPAKNAKVTFPRTRPTSAREALDTLRQFLSGAGYTLSDISKFTLKLFQYMTTSNLRREQELEDISFWDYVEGESYAEPFRHDLDVAPAILGALVARKSDARTQGSVSVQLLMDQLGMTERTDALLNGPTTDAWFRPWREYLEDRGVEFRQGELVDFTLLDVDGTPQVLPIVEQLDPPQALDPKQFRDAYFVLAPALPDLTGRPAPGDPRGAMQPGLARRFLQAIEARGQTASDTAIPSHWDISDFTALEAMAPSNWNLTSDSSLQHLIGIQYFFHYNDRQFVSGHSVYFDSDWRLSAISQTRFWCRSAEEDDPYVGIFSVDIGDVWRPSKFRFYPEPASHGRSGEELDVPCWGATPQAIAQGALDQIRRASPDNDPVPPPLSFHLDQGLSLDEEGRVWANDTPYLVNRPGEWSKRPGCLPNASSSPDETEADWNYPNGTQPQADRWFLAGTFMRTFTRLTTMEAANESARHAVNGILWHDARCRQRTPIVDPCPVWNIEEEEPADLRWLKELDERLCQRGLPHFVEILGLDSIPESVLPALKHLYEPWLRKSAYRARKP